MIVLISAGLFLQKSPSLVATKQIKWFFQAILLMIGPETVFLLVLVIALIIGNGLLYLFRPRPSFHSRTIARVSKNIEPVPGIGEIHALRASHKALNQKVSMAHQRLGELEKSIRFSKGKPLKADSAFLSELSRRIQELDEFSASTKIELAALRQMLSDKKLRASKRRSTEEVEKRLKSTGKEADELEEKIRSIVFRAGK